MKTTFKNSTTISQEIERIFSTLSRKASDDTVVIKEKVHKGSSCCGMISIIKCEDFRRQKEDGSYKATPIVRYAFYPSTYFPSRLGSVAIYGEGAMALCCQLKGQRTLLGRKIIDAVVEFGKRPFVDVRLRV